VRILIVGGTGFIGFHAVNAFLRKSHRVTVLSLPPMPSDDYLPEEVEIILEDINELSDEVFRTLLGKQDAVVFAAGADDRVVPKAPAYSFFYSANVKSCVRFFRLAREAGVKRGVLLGSYFAHFDRIWPEMRLSDRHPYIRSRQEQERQALEAAMPDLELMILELPYIFGAAPGRTPLWALLIRYIRLPIPLFYTRGGTNIIAVKHVAEAIVGAVEKGKAGERYLIGDENVSWVDLLNRLIRIMGLKKKVVILPDSSVQQASKAILFFHRLKGLESGLDPVAFAKLQTKNTFFDPAPSRKALGYGQGGIEEALEETVRACFPSLSQVALGRDIV
jgi:dihydroflavonol-4-reductase